MRVFKSFLVISLFTMMTAPHARAGAQFVRACALDELSRPIRVRLAEKATYVKRALTSLQKRSAEVSQTILQKNKNGESYVVDVLGIGGGPQNAMLMSSIETSNPSLSTLVIEADDTLGVFHALGDSYRFNSKEYADVSFNTFYSCPIQPSDFNLTGEQFLPADAFGNATIAAYAASGSDLIFNNKVKSIQKCAKDCTWPAKYRIETDKGLVVYAHRIAGALGQGKPKRPADPATAKLLGEAESLTRQNFAQGQLEGAQPIESIDDTLERANRISEHNLEPGVKKIDPLAAFENRTVVVVGKGDGGKIACEFLGGHAPRTLYRDGKPSRGPQKVIWLGQDAKTSAEFRENKANMRRYHDSISGMYDNQQLVAQPGRFLRTEPITSGADQGKMRVYFTDENGKETSIVSDFVQLATGYDDAMTEILSPLNVTATQVMTGVTDHSDGKLVFLGRQVVTADGPEDIYLHGFSARPRLGEDYTHEEHRNAGGYMNMFGTRSEAVGQRIADSMATEHPFNPVTIKSGTDEYRESLPTPQKSAFAYEVEVMNLKTNLGRVLRKFRFPPGKFSFTVNKNDFVIHASDIEKEEFAAFVDQLKQDSELIGSLFSVVGRKNVLFVEFPVKPDGRPQLDELSFH